MAADGRRGTPPISDTQQTGGLNRYLGRGVDHFE